MTAKPVRVLLVEDHPDDCLMLLEAVRQGGFDPVHECVATEASMRAALEGQAWDIVLADYQLARFSALGAIELLKKLERDIPLVIVSGTIGEERAVALLKAGAQDFLTKGNLARLVPAIERELDDAEGRRGHSAAEAALRLSEKRLATAQRIARLSHWEWNLVDGSVWWSDALCDIIGLAPDVEPSFKAFMSRVHHDDAARVRAELEGAVRDQTGLESCFRIDSRGEERHIHMLGQMVLDQEGRPIQLFGTAQDVTGRVRTEADLRQRTLDLTERVKELHCLYAVSDEVGRTDAPLEESLKRIVSLLPAALTFNDHAFARLTRNDGTYVAGKDAGAASGRVVVHEHGQPVGFLEVGYSGDHAGAPLVFEQDELLKSVGSRIELMLSRMDSREVLERSEGYHRSLNEHAQDLITVIDADTTVRYASPSYATVLGHDPADLIGTSALAMVHPDDQQRLISVMTEGLREPGAVRRMVYRFQHRNGDWRLMEASGRNMLHDEIVHGIVINSRDVTERDRLETQFRQAQKMEAVGRLAGGVAHDFNNVLTAITGHAELMLMDLNKADPMVADLKEIADAAHRGASFTRQLLAFSRQQVLSPHVIQLNDVLRNVTPMLYRLIGEDVTLKTELEDDLGLISADPGQVEQIVMNLVVNARDAMPAGGAIVVATSNREDHLGPHNGSSPRPTGPWVVLSVTDNGTGMDARTQAQIFEPFFTTKEIGRGTGLGLSTVYGIVTQSGGHIEVDTELGKGSTFRIFMPATVDDATATEARAPFDVITGLGGTETILLTEDDPSVRRVALLTLTKAGYTVIEAANAGEALRINEREAGRIDLLLTDVVMPHMSGVQLVERLRAKRPSMAVLYMSGYMERVMSGPELALTGMFLQKPFTREQLLKKIRQVFESEAALAAAS